jgi:hypothetical protein
MENNSFIANNLNSALYKTFDPLNFVNNLNWEFFSKVVNDARVSNISFQIRLDEFYDLSSLPNLESVFEIYANLELIQSKKMAVVKTQEFQKAVELREEEISIIQKIREFDFKETDKSYVFFTPNQSSIIQIKQFKNKSLNQNFLKQLGFNI